MKDNKNFGLLSDDELKEINSMNIDLESNVPDDVTSAGGAAAGAAAGAGFMLMGM